MLRIHNEWENRVIAEYTSASVTAQVVHWMIICGLSEEQIQVGLRIVGDELAHARLSHEALVALDGSSDPAAIDARRLSIPTPEGVWIALIDTILQSFCLGETFAVPLFDAMRRNASHPTVVAMLKRVLQDEAIHRAFGWTVLESLLEIDPEGVKRRVYMKIPSWLKNYQEAYAHGVELNDTERSCGLLDGGEYRKIVKNTIMEGILPRFKKRGIELEYTPLF